MSVPVKIYRSVTFQEGQTPSNPNLSGDPNINPLNPDGGPAEDLVPYVGADKNVNLGEFGLSTGYVTFDTTPTGTPATQGTTYWDDSKSTVALIMNGTTQHIGQDQFIYVKNSTGSPIAKGVAVRNSGTDGGSGHILIEPMLANGTNASETFIGVTAEAIANGSFGQVMAFGELAGINTSTYTAGAFLYVSTTVAGQFQTTAPVAPNNIILVGRAINSKNNGDIFIRPHIGSNINNDEGVRITSPATGDLLQRQSNGLWENRTLSQVIGTAYVPSTRTLTINGTAFDLSANRSWSVGTVTDVTAGTGIAVFPNPTSATPQVALTGQALSFHSLSGTGFVYRTSGIVGVRTLTAGTGITITNGDGVSGNPTISASVTQSISTFTPTLTGTGATYTVGSSACLYIKTGRLVSFTIDISVSNTGTPTGRLTIANFPFEAQSSVDSNIQNNSITISQFAGSNISSTDISKLRAYTDTSTSTFRIRFDLIDDDTFNGLTVSFPSTGYIKLSGWYISTT